jgi:hypothetical protein
VATNQGEIEAGRETGWRLNFGSGITPSKRLDACEIFKGN